MDIDKAFEKCVKVTSRKETIGRSWKAECVKGNFSVEGRNLDAVMSDALHYFQQYYSDGEYEYILRQL